jgi:hypothetical protein
MKRKKFIYYRDAAGDHYYSTEERPPAGAVAVDPPERGAAVGRDYRCRPCAKPGTDRVLWVQNHIPVPAGMVEVVDAIDGTTDLSEKEIDADGKVVPKVAVKS